MEVVSYITVQREVLVKTRMKELRARDNLTQAKLAQLVEVRRETIVFLEQGKYNPSLSLAHAISRVFNLAIEEVFIFDQVSEK
jgi:putative transcriptional regulator